MDRLTLASISAQKAGMSYGNYMASMYTPVAVDIGTVDEPKKRVCSNCGKVISKYAHKSRRYCSDSCRYEHGKQSTIAKYHERKGHIVENRESRPCQYCGKDIPKHLHGSTRYCSLECQHERAKEKARAKWDIRKDEINEKRRAMRNGQVRNP